MSEDKRLDEDIALYEAMVLDLSLDEDYRSIACARATQLDELRTLRAEVRSLRIKASAFDQVVAATKGEESHSGTYRDIVCIIAGAEAELSKIDE